MQDSENGNLQIVLSVRDVTQHAACYPGKYYVIMLLCLDIKQCALRVYLRVILRRDVRVE